MFRQRLLLTFSVKGDIRYLSHHDLMRVLERAVRRAELPVACSQGFNPRPRISILQARGVGVASEGEFVELDFDGWLGAEKVRRDLSVQLPEGLDLLSVSIADPGRHAQVTTMEYRVDFRKGIPFDAEKVGSLLSASAIPVQRERKGKTKSVDLKPVLADLRLTDGALYMTFRVTDQGSARPEEILQALGVSIDEVRTDCRLTRTVMTLDVPPGTPGPGR